MWSKADARGKNSKGREGIVPHRKTATSTQLSGTGKRQGEDSERGLDNERQWCLTANSVSLQGKPETEN